ncbi:arylsulfatase (plasmid) [Cupriavidus sp. KK10]|jgi:arylsulfatase|uniref:arylsulfatase n=1 Tax=Cupriavidus sp. KK10 TaxID=1478019 RepID=UPI001BABD99A|nr:arylsulfatase [Cupriavidus sp. KK10]QUN32787.1 arylsulfatase [Cupriavidus sp. KK10]
MKHWKRAFSVLAAVLALTSPFAAAAQQDRPNILVIWGDDIGWENVSAYGMGVMGYTTPNIDSIGMAGIRFTDHYGQPSCTAGRAAFITGQYPIRSGMTTVGQPGDKLGWQAASPSLAEVLKAAGYRTGHFGKSHMGDLNEHLPTAHGFDEFYGNLYHLNTEELPEYPDYKAYADAYPGGAKAFAQKFASRGVLHSFATDKDDPTVMPRFGRVGRQTIEDSGPLTMKRMEDFDGAEVIPKAIDFMQRSRQEGKPFFVWLNTSRMHLYTHLNEKWRYAASKYTHQEDMQGSGMLQHDHDVGMALDFLKRNGLDNNTIVWYSTDNGPEHSSWPHGATTPFRGEKMTTYEGGVRVISMLRWPGVIKPGQIKNGIQAHQDMFSSLAAIGGVPDVAERMKQEKTQYIDGVNNVDYWTGKAQESARKDFLYYYENKLTAVRMGPWKLHFSLKENYYAELRPQTFPMLFNLRSDPFESYDSKDSYGHLIQQAQWLSGPLNELMANHLKSLAEYPPVQPAKSFDRSNFVQDFLQQQKRQQAAAKAQARE